MERPEEGKTHAVGRQPVLLRKDEMSEGGGGKFQEGLKKGGHMRVSKDVKEKTERILGGAKRGTSG